MPNPPSVLKQCNALGWVPPPLPVLPLPPMPAIDLHNAQTRPAAPKTKPSVDGRTATSDEQMTELEPEREQNERVPVPASRRSITNNYTVDRELVLIPG